MRDEPRPERGTDTVALAADPAGIVGLPVGEMTADQQRLARQVLADLLAPFREADRRESLKLIEQNGIDKLRFTYYKNLDIGSDGIWDVWQVEGPALVWYFRGSPHVHVWVSCRESGVSVEGRQSKQKMQYGIPGSIWLAVPWAAVMLAGGLPLRAAEPGPATRGMVASVHRLATEAGVAALQRGGNAVDAAVAAALTLGVVDGFNSGIGGGCLILLRTPDGRLVAIDGRETAPLKAHRDMFLRDGQPQPDRSKTGPLAVATPGALAAYDEATRHFGRLSLRDLLLPAAEIAEAGFPLPRNYARALAENSGTLAKFPGSRAVLLKPGGSPYREGETLRQPDLARTYRTVAEKGVEWFYRGAFASIVGDWMAAQGGLLAADDFGQYRVQRREPLISRYRGHTIVGFPPPSSGGVHVAQMLNILEHFDLRRLHDQDPAQFAHVVIEAMKRAFADRAHWLGDADFVSVPRGLVEEAYADELAQQIDVERARVVAGHGEPPRAAERLLRRPHNARRGRRRPGLLGRPHGYGQHYLWFESHCAPDRCRAEQPDGRFLHPTGCAQCVRPDRRRSERRGSRQDARCPA